VFRHVFYCQKKQRDGNLNLGVDAKIMIDAKYKADKNKKRSEG
jgi:hypothetical protein